MTDLLLSIITVIVLLWLLGLLISFGRLVWAVISDSVTYRREHQEEGIDDADPA